MIKITAIILTKNAESLIADCIDSVSFCDEIIVIDDNSTDRTRDVAKMMQATVLQYVNDSFAKKRNLGLKKAKGKWIFYIDADERVSADLKKRVLEIVDRRTDSFSAYRVNRKNYYLGNNEWPTGEKLERLFKKIKLVEWFGEVHESPRVDGSIGDITQGYLIHYTHQDLTSMLNKTIQWSKIEAELRYKNSHPQMTWWRFFRVMYTGFFESYIKQKGYKVGTAGFIESMFQSYSMFITYARLWELQKKSTKK